MSVANRDNRVHSLDVLRGLAVLLVLVRHLPNADASAVLSFVQSIGWTGVDLFFVLSGFLISGLLFTEFDNTGSIGLKRFWLRRGFKIWPSYFFTYGTAMLLTIAVTGNTQLLIERAPNYVFVQNYMDFHVRWTHSWSVAIEEHFYLILPLVLLVLIPSRFQRLPKIILTICVSILMFRIALYFLRDLPWPNFYYPTHMRMDSLCFGVLLGYWYQYRRDDFIRAGRKFWPYLSIAPVVLVLAHIYPVEQSGFSITVGFTIFYLTFGGLVVLARAYPAFGSSGPQRLIAAMGVYSYTIYLAHSVIYELPGINSARVLVQSNFGNTGDRFLFFFASIMLGILLSHAIERPFLKLRAKWLPAAPKPATHCGQPLMPFESLPRRFLPHRRKALPRF
jgi:peptidoglycan/LPS O-acetylase OafA/YrhL